MESAEDNWEFFYKSHFFEQFITVENLVSRSPSLVWSDYNVEIILRRGPAGNLINQYNVAVFGENDFAAFLFTSSISKLAGTKSAGIGLTLNTSVIAGIYEIAVFSHDE